MRLALAATLIAGAAMAEEAAINEAVIAACTDRHGNQPELCIGIARELCLYDGGDSSTVAMSACFAAEHAYWDARLNGAYRRLVAQEEAYMAEMAEIGATVPDTVAALRDMEQAWIRYRDAACAYDRSQWGGGTGGGPAGIACLADLTGAQALALEARLDTP